MPLASASLICRNELSHASSAHPCQACRLLMEKHPEPGPSSHPKPVPYPVWAQASFHSHLGGGFPGGILTALSWSPRPEGMAGGHSGHQAADPAWGRSGRLPRGTEPL